MGKYASGFSYGQIAMMEKEAVRHALECEARIGEDENGFVYALCSKEEADKIILKAYDAAVYQALDMMASARALERCWQDATPDMNEKERMQKYIPIKWVEDRKFDDYRYEQDEDLKTMME